MLSTLKLSGCINGHKVVILIDGGSTNNFIQNRLAKHLGLSVVALPNLKVTVENGETLGCWGKCLQVSVSIDSAQFLMYLFLLPIYGANLVFGVQWLAKLGAVLFNYKELWMELGSGPNTARFYG